MQRQCYYQQKTTSVAELLAHHRDMQTIAGGGFIVIEVGQVGFLQFRCSRKLGGVIVKIEKIPGNAYIVLPKSIASTHCGHCCPNNSTQKPLSKMIEFKPIHNWLKKKPKMVNLSLLARYGPVDAAKILDNKPEKPLSNNKTDNKPNKWTNNNFVVNDEMGKVYKY
eukprot:250715_1